MYALGGPPGYPRPVPAPSKPRYVVSEAMKEAIRGELKSLLDGEISSASLQKLLKFARAARAILLTEKPGAGLARPGIYPHMHPAMDPDGPDEDSDLPAMGTGEYMGGALAQAPYPETFGTAVIREAIAALPKLQQKPDKLPDLLDALRMAQEDGLTEVANQIKMKITARLKEDAVPVPTVFQGDEPPLDWKKPIDNDPQGGPCDDCPPPGQNGG